MALILAHRGASPAGSDVVENTLEAFGLALDLGADGVELDARLTADGVLVVHHDAAWSPWLPGIGERAGRPVSATGSSERPPIVPTLAEALDRCSRGVVPRPLVNIELKADPGPDAALATARALVDLLRRRAGRDRVVVSSFDATVLDAVRDLLGPDPGRPPLAWLTTSPVDAVEARNLVARGLSAIHPVVGVVDEALVRVAHDVGLGVGVWTVNDPADLRRMTALGVDVVITDRPDVALGVRSGPA
jgi:glycerophosphoryl diester phosphodiesterase